LRLWEKPRRFPSVVIARQNETWIEPASVAALIGTFASAVTLTTVMWFIQTGRLAFP
jgi:malonate transporter and related proteins